MTEEEMRKMAWEAGFTMREFDLMYSNELIKFFKLAIKAENESIALLVETMGAQGYGTLAIAASIRKRQRKQQQLTGDLDE